MFTRKSVYICATKQKNMEQKANLEIVKSTHSLIAKGEMINGKTYYSKSKKVKYNIYTVIDLAINSTFFETKDKASAKKFIEVYNATGKTYYTGNQGNIQF